MGRRRDSEHDLLPDARDGLTRLERIVLSELAAALRELGQRAVPAALLYGRVVEHVAVGPAQFLRTLARMRGFKQ